jgi:hypothetical protein
VSSAERPQPAAAVADAITREAVLKTLLDTIDAEYKAARAAVQEALDAQAAASGAKSFDAKLPGGVTVGTVTLTGGGTAAAVTDTAAFTEWVRERYPSEMTVRIVREVREAWQADLLARATAAGAAVDTDTGEEIPGVEIRPSRARSHSVRFAKDGRALVGEAWRTGLLGPVLPAIAPAAANGTADGGEDA